MRILNSCVVLSCLWILTSFSICIVGNIYPELLIKDGGDTLVSPERKFVLGFFSPTKSEHRYLGIWYEGFNTKFVVWVANRDDPLTDSSGVLMITSTGNLILVQTSTNTTVWSSNTPTVAKYFPKAQMLDSGNFVVREMENSIGGKILWQSFDHPTDTLLPSMKLGLDLRSSLNRFLTSWKSENDPSSGDHMYMMDTEGSHEIYVKSKNISKFHLGPWNGKEFCGNPAMEIYEKLEFEYVSNDTDAYYTFGYEGGGVMSRLVMNSNGILKRLGWSIESQSWENYWSAPNDDCDDYSRCGVNGLCDLKVPGYCNCLRGFTPKSSIAWKAQDFSMGCKLVVNSHCNTSGEGFLPLEGVKYPDITNSTIDKRIDLDDCRSKCLANCSCMAFSRYYTEDAISNGEPMGCIMWYGELNDIRRFPFGGQNIFLKVPGSELLKEEKKKMIKLVIIVISSIFAMTIGGILLGVFIWRRKKMKKKQHNDPQSKTGIKTMTLNYDENNRKWKIELNIFYRSTIASATNNFSKDNKIGQGGFGVVYKGKLDDGQEIAVKRLSKVEGQGIHEKMFINEAGLIANCQHRNLVRLIGCCMEGDESMFVFEFMPNKSLNTIIFGKNRHLVDWKKRVEIILGISKGLLYLHEDARFKIIHRDIKAGNILLDEAMNPKITDFGTARLFGSEIVEETTRFKIGTHGYMSPEYAMEGIFSPKSDVFSFGVLLLEIISGRKALVINHNCLEMNLLELVWKLYEDGKGIELLDKTISSSGSMLQVLRFIKIGLLCVQEYASDRPDMSAVVFMLSNENSPIPEPTPPGFCKHSEDNASTSN